MGIEKRGIEIKDTNGMEWYTGKTYIFGFNLQPENVGNFY